MLFMILLVANIVYRNIRWIEEIRGGVNTEAPRVAHGVAAGGGGGAGRGERGSRPGGGRVVGQTTVAGTCLPFSLLPPPQPPQPPPGL